MNQKLHNAELELKNQKSKKVSGCFVFLYNYSKVGIIYLFLFFNLAVEKG